MLPISFCGCVGKLFTTGRKSEAGFDKWYVGISNEDGAVCEKLKSPSGQPIYWDSCASLHGASDRIVEWNEFDGASMGRSFNMG